MLLKDLITSPDQIVIGVEARERWTLIEELIQHLVDTGHLPAPQRTLALEAVKEREATMSTGIGHGIGIPHAAVSGIDKVLATLAVSRHDIEFDALDGAPVRLAILFIVPESHFQQHLNTLADVARVLGDAPTRARLSAVATPEQAIAVIRGAAPAA